VTGQRLKSILWRLSFSVLLSFEIVYSVAGSIFANACKSGFDPYGAFIVPMLLFGPRWLLGYSPSVVVALIALPLSPKTMSAKSIRVLILTPMLIYVILGGGLYLSLLGRDHNFCRI
jgi:hypothetical protein